MTKSFIQQKSTGSLKISFPTIFFIQKESNRFQQTYMFYKHKENGVFYCIDICQAKKHTCLMKLRSHNNLSGRNFLTFIVLVSVSNNNKNPKLFSLFKEIFPDFEWGRTCYKQFLLLV